MSDTLAIPQITVSDEEAEFVARAADIDGRLNWDTADHDAVVERDAAISQARTFIAHAKAIMEMPRSLGPTDEPQPGDVGLRPIEAGTGSDDPTTTADNTDGTGDDDKFPPPAPEAPSQDGQAAS